jgi:hypothetical protein
VPALFDDSRKNGRVGKVAHPKALLHAISFAFAAALVCHCMLPLCRVRRA